MRDVEILVHVNAPSRVSDDATYRQLAQAYLDFEPASRTALPLLDDKVDDDEGKEGDAVARHAQPCPALSSSQDLYGSSSQPIAIDSQDLSFSGALDNRSSPCFQGYARHYQQQQYQHALDQDVIPSSLLRNDDGSDGSYVAPPSQISDSYPMPGAVLHVSPTRILERFVRGTAAFATTAPQGLPTPSHRLDQASSPSSHRSSSLGAAIPSSLPPQPPPRSQESLGPGDGNTGNIVPQTPVPPSLNKRHREEIENRVDEPAWDVTHMTGSDLSIHPALNPISPSRADSEPPPVKRVKSTDQSVVAAINIAKSLVRSSSDTGVTHPRSTPDRKQLDTLEIMPPSPPVGVGDIDPSTLVSEKLAKLAADLSSRYRPESKREIQSMERGFWLVDCSAWSEETRFDTWAFLTSYLRSGLAGWAVWCRRDEAHQRIRLYCWGHIAKHTYLLLYLASGRHLKFTGAEWRDADGEVALKVHPHERQAT